ncbi:RNA polymerase-binding transcription factor DksA [Geomicrobium halophilum]|uniref:RNA polymerase-binding transcription factor DksA n=1 Tax=Geomicrobium halophilum TaxID=549000 RepID=A0A841PKV0_9BACL|nr:TraR/DksA C4-type zinc finger protein [Geomicrobium halophilum]MBB6449369.1 RNA polymerase-binding transcription factor DksA [Geomicrobium halophilum]
MTDKEVAIQMLYDRKHELENHEAIVNDSGRDNELSVYDNHPADSSDIFYEASKDQALRYHRSHEYEEILHALEKVEQGTYGICEETGKEIPGERLRAHPIARTVPVEQRGSHPLVAPPPGNASPEVNQALHVNGDGALDGIDMWEAVMNTTEEDDGYRETATTDFWVEQPPGFTEDIERFLTTDVDGYRGIEHVDFARNEDYRMHMDEEENWR